MHIYKLSTEDLIKQENEVNDHWSKTGMVTDLICYSEIIRELTKREEA